MTNNANKFSAALRKHGVASTTNQKHELYLSTGIPNLDYAISGLYVGGGIKTGRIVEIAAEESVGKTLIAQHIMVEAQRAGGAARFHDHEGTFRIDLAESFGLDTTEGVFTLDEPNSLEESLDRAIDWMTSIREEGIGPEVPLVVVFDSIPAMIPLEVVEHDISKGRNMRQKWALPAALATELPAFNDFVKKNNVVAVFLNHMKENPLIMHGDPRKTPGGKSMDFYASTRIFMGRSFIRENGKTGAKIGQKITAEAVKNKVHKPWEKTSWLFKTKPDGGGYIDIIESMVEHVHEIKGFEQAGAYFVWEGKKLHKPALIKTFRDMPDGLKALIALSEKTQGLADD